MGGCLTHSMPVTTRCLYGARVNRGSVRCSLVIVDQSGGAKKNKYEYFLAISSNIYWCSGRSAEGLLRTTNCATKSKIHLCIDLQSRSKMRNNNNETAYAQQLHPKILPVLRFEFKYSMQSPSHLAQYTYRPGTASCRYRMGFCHIAIL